ncbi:hypothetical protein [Paraliomyxa miuraensis]|uniref:hypothetical protein n=1 Tax=Paraliomyxa miuraensis TaxID=376150 RepID=UPI0022535C9F|nr:hypothetical protein [Paraliomyxa miuraensis]MCX4240883.1 hypothetical protein [Paraliomyxa miuraensis]
MPTIGDLCLWLRHNMRDLRLSPDVIGEAHGPSGPVVRIRWHEIAYVGGKYLGVGVELVEGRLLGEVWMYGPGVGDVRMHAGHSVVIPAPVKSTLCAIARSHAAHREPRGSGRSTPRPSRSSATAQELLPMVAGW